jgi:hypothetical protein
LRSRMFCWFCQTQFSVPRALLRQYAWEGGVLLLLGLTVMQTIVFEGSSLAQNRRVRPVLESLCATTGCVLPAFIDRQKIQVVRTDLNPAPNNIDGFEFELALINQSTRPQTFPRIKLVLTALNGHPAAARIFNSEDYLPADSDRLMLVGKAYDIQLLLAAPPGHEVGGFSFDLL